MKTFRNKTQWSIKFFIETKDFVVVIISTLTYEAISHTCTCHYGLFVTPDDVSCNMKMESCNSVNRPFSTDNIFHKRCIMERAYVKNSQPNLNSHFHQFAIYGYDETMKTFSSLTRDAFMACFLSPDVITYRSEIITGQKFTIISLVVVTRNFRLILSFKINTMDISVIVFFISIDF